MNRKISIVMGCLCIALLSGCAAKEPLAKGNADRETEPVIVIGENSDVKNIENEEDVTEESLAEGSADKGKTAEESLDKGKTAEESSDKGSAAEGKIAEESLDKGSAAEESLDKGSTAEESLTEGSADKGSTEKEAECISVSKQDSFLLQYIGSSSQIITVEAAGSSAKVTLYDRLPDDTFEQVLSTDASIGKNGIGKEREGDCKTPAGVYHFTMAFGSQANPGSIIPYTQVDNRYVWVDDPASVFYNKFIDTTQVVQDWSSAEKLFMSSASYNYALALDYNSSCTPGKGSAIFMHCLPTKGFGCIAVPQEVMRQMLTLVKPDCVIYIY